jgi:hypothetical protein
VDRSHSNLLPTPSNTLPIFFKWPASGSNSDGDHVGGGAPNLVPHENKFKTLIPASDKARLRQSYNILDLVRLHFQGPRELSNAGDYVAITEKMLMVGFRFPFPSIALELMVRLGVAPSQIKLNGWRYLFASFIIWRI